MDFLVAIVDGWIWGCFGLPLLRGECEIFICIHSHVEKKIFFWQTFKFLIHKKHYEMLPSKIAAPTRQTIIHQDYKIVKKKKLQLLRNFIKQVNRHSYVCDQKLRYCIKHLHDTPSKKSRHWKNHLKHNLFFYCIISNAVKIPRVIKKNIHFRSTLIESWHVFW